MKRASFVALDTNDQSLVGGCFIPLLPDGAPTDATSYYWDTPPPAEAVERCLGRPHLTWIFVHPLMAGNDIGTSLLAASVRELSALGYQQLFSTFLLGNE